MPYFDDFGRLRPTQVGEEIVRIKRLRILRYLRDNNVEGRALLEIGPGRGMVAKLCHDMGLEYTGVEVNESIAARLEGQGFSILRAYVPPLPTDLKGFDFAFCSHVIEHMPTFREAQSLLEDMRDAVKPGGLVCVGGPDYFSWGPHFWHGHYSHSFVITNRRLIQMFVDAGLIVLKDLYFAGPFCGWVTTPISRLARLFPDTVIGLFLKPFVNPERLYKAKVSFLRRVFVVGRRPEGEGVRAIDE